MAGTVGIAGTDSSPVAPEFAETGVGMWAGELWYYRPVLCDPKFSYEDTVPMPTAEGYRWRAILILDSDGEQLEGHIALGEGELPSAPSVLPSLSTDDPFMTCSNFHPAVGGIYTIRSAAQRQERLTFEIAPNEIWDGWCRRERYVCTVSTCGSRNTCTCDGDVCGADLSHRMIIDLTATADALEGVLRYGGFSPELRLRRVQ